MDADILRMAREAGTPQWWLSDDALARFADLARADERERIKAANAPEIERINEHIKALEEAVADEREACARVCDAKVDAEYATGKVDHNEMGWTQACAIAIRARSKSC